MANNHDTRRKLKALYALIPTFECRPGCIDCCGPVPFARREWAPIQDKRHAGPDTLTCPYADTQGCSGCTIYAQRPLLCRLFGATLEPRLTCPHGCAPAQPLTAAQTTAIFGDYRKLMED